MWGGIPIASQKLICIFALNNKTLNYGKIKTVWSDGLFIALSFVVSGTFLCQ